MLGKKDTIKSAVLKSCYQTMILKFILSWQVKWKHSSFPSLGSAVLTRRQKEKELSPVYFLSVNSDCLKIKVNRLSNIII